MLSKLLRSRILWPTCQQSFATISKGPSKIPPPPPDTLTKRYSRISMVLFGIGLISYILSHKKQDFKNE